MSDLSLSVLVILLVDRRSTAIVIILQNAVLLQGKHHTSESRLELVEIFNCIAVYGLVVNRSGAQFSKYLMTIFDNAKS